MGRKDHHKVVPFSRDYRRAPKFDMGLPPRRPNRAARRGASPVRYLKAVVVLGTAGLFFLPSLFDAVMGLSKSTASSDAACRVMQVVDGDTVTLTCSDGPERVRLTGFDAPELFSPQCATEAAAAIKAKWALRLMLFQADQLRFVREGRDRYDRVLMRGFVDGETIASRMISAGHARLYDGGLRQGWCA